MGDLVTIVIVSFGCALLLIIVFLYKNDRKQMLSREYIIKCNESNIIQLLNNYESDNLCTRLVSNNDNTYTLHCSASHMMDYSFNIYFKHNNENVIMVIFPSDRITNYGGAEYSYIMKLDSLMKKYAEF